MPIDNSRKTEYIIGKEIDVMKTTSAQFKVDARCVSDQNFGMQVLYAMATDEAQKRLESVGVSLDSKTGDVLQYYVSIKNVEMKSSALYSLMLDMSADAEVLYEWR